MRDGDDLRRRPLIERKSALGKLLIRSRGSIQYVEHAEGRLQTRARGHRFKEARCALSVRTIEKLDQGQESKSASGYADS